MPYNYDVTINSDIIIIRHALMAKFSFDPFYQSHKPLITREQRETEDE